jgi:protein TonB
VTRVPHSTRLTLNTPLFEFMPYGAPELREAASRHMLRALGLASALWLAMFALGIFSSSWTRVPPEEVRVRILPPLVITPPTFSPPAPVPPPTTPRAPHVEPVPGRTVPVPDDVRVVDQDHGGPQGPPAGPPAGEHGVPPDEAAPVVQDPLPEFGKWIYTDQLPLLIREIEPEYPDIAKQAGIEGRVVVYVLVGRDGRVLDARVDPHFSVAMLDEAALAAARKMIFEPALANHQPVAVWVAKPYRFALH